MTTTLKRVFLLLILTIAGFCIYFSIGSEVTQYHDDHVYELPFKEGTKFKIVQGYGGRFSHKNKAALDFDMPEGTPIYAARGGIVFSFKENSNEGAPHPSYNRKANYIIIRHNDGSFGCYWHLKKNGIVRKEGKVEQGELIAYSGRTGFVLMPHLHFAVKRKLNYDMNSFVKTKFQTMSGIEYLASGEAYEKPTSSNLSSNKP